MEQIVTPPDLESFLCGLLRARLGVEVDVKQPAGWDASAPLVVVRDDGGPMTGERTYSRAVGVTVYAGTRQDVSGAGALARRAMAVLSSNLAVASPGSPVASVDLGGFNGPYRVTDGHDTSAWYLTASYSVVGEVGEI